MLFSVSLPSFVNTRWIFSAATANGTFQPLQEEPKHSNKSHPAIKPLNTQKINELFDFRYEKKTTPNSKKENKANKTQIH